MNEKKIALPNPFCRKKLATILAIAVTDVTTRYLGYYPEPEDADFIRVLIIEKEELHYIQYRCNDIAVFRIDYSNWDLVYHTTEKTST